MPIRFRAWDKREKRMWPVSALHSNGMVHVDIPRQINSTMLRNTSELPIRGVDSLLTTLRSAQLPCGRLATRIQNS